MYVKKILMKIINAEKPNNNPKLAPEGFSK